MIPRCVIVGASHAASQLCISLRQNGWEGDIVVIGDEDALPYHRPPLSKELLSSEKELDDLLIRPAKTYSDADVEFRLSTRATKIDPSEKLVFLDDGSSLSFDKLVLATGARPRPLPVPGGDSDGVFLLRSKDDVTKIKSSVSKGARSVIIGGGYIGLEAAASLTKLGVKVTLLEAMDRILQRVTAPEVSSFYRRIHKEEGIVILENEQVSSIDEHDGEISVKTLSEQRFVADFVIVGIGVIPNSELAEQAGLEVGNGIVVNCYGQTSDPDIYAVGDVAWHHNPIYDRSWRIESVPNATEQAKTVASHIQGQEKPFSDLPWFWSDQFDLKLQIVGVSDGYDNIVVRGNLDSGRAVAVFYFQDDRLLAVDAVNSPKAFMATKMVLTKGLAFDKKTLADTETDIRQAIVS